MGKIGSGKKEFVQELIQKPVLTGIFVTILTF